MRVLSLFLPRTPSGPGMCLICTVSFLPANSRAMWPMSTIETISSEPIFSGSLKSEWKSLKTPFKQSVGYKVRWLTFHAVVDVAKGSGLQTITPHLEAGLGGRASSLPAESSRSLLSATLPGSLRAVDIVKPADSELDTEVLVVVLAKLLGGELF